MSSASIREISGVNFILCHGGSVTNTGFPLTQIAELLFPNFSFISAPNGDARIKILGLSKGTEACHISTVPYDTVREIALKNKISISSSGSKIRIVTLPGLRRLQTVHQRRAGIQMLKPFVDACVEALASSSPNKPAPSLRLLEANPSAIKQESNSDAVVQSQLPLMLEAKPVSVEEPSRKQESSSSMETKIDYMTSRINELMEIVNRKSPLSARFQWLAIHSLAEIFETESDNGVEMLIRVQYVANTLIQERKAEGYDIQYAPPPSSTPLLSHRLARLVVNRLEKEGFCIKPNFVRP